MLKQGMLFVTYSLSSVILLATSLLLFQLSPPLATFDEASGVRGLMWLHQLPNYALPLLSLFLALIFVLKAVKVAKNWK
ncbi:MULTISPECIES: hypothetical protein [unclassified Streptococcus]|uniref:hypothetical protein n=1 Tax=unclassified Streptococcus TaxID=2608887 RepID=UPI00359E1CD3